MKKLIQFLFVMVPIAVMAQETGTKAFSYSVELEATPETIWAAITDYTSFKSWDANIVDVRCPDTVEKNQICQAIFSTGEMAEVAIVEMKDNESYTLRYKISSGNIYIKRALNATSTPALTETVWYKGMSRKTFEKYKGTDYAEVLKERMLGFKGYIERGTAKSR